MCIFESDTVKSDCPVQIFRKIMKYLKFALLVLLFFLEILKKEKKKTKLWKKSSENDQSTGHFQSFFIYFFRPPTLDLKKKSRKSTYKKNPALWFQMSDTPC